MTDNHIQNAIRDAIRLLALRAHSRAELSTKLKKKEFDADTIEAAMAKLESLGLIDDRAFAESFMGSMSRRRPEGKIMARMRMLQKGVSEELVDEMLSGYDTSAMCLAAAEKKMRSLAGAPESKRKKLETFLRNRGFDWQTIKETLEIVSSDK
jgi:regulatory protein